MRISDILGLSLANLWKRKMRTLLTVLGVIIGTASIVVMLSLGLGLKESMMAQVSSAGGLTEIFVYSDAGYGSDDLLLDDKTIELFSGMDYVETVHPQMYYGMPIQIGKYEGYIDLMGVTSEYMEMIELEEGDYPEPGNNMSIIVGNQMPMMLMDAETGEWPDFEDDESPEVDFMSSPVTAGIEEEATYDPESETDVDEEEPIEGLTDFTVEEDFTVEGADFEDDSEDSSIDETDGEFTQTDLEEDDWEENDWEEESYSYFTPEMKRVQLKVSGITAGDMDTYTDNCYTDIEMLKKFLRNNYSQNSVIPGQPTDRNGKPYRDFKYSQLIVKVDEADNVETVLEEIQSLGYQADANKEWLEQTEKEFMLIEAVLGGIGAVAMLVAAISIANTMTMSIYERTKEIGVMKVLGCGLGNIRSMFLAEAAFIGFIGGAFGLGLSFLLSFLLNHYLAPTVMSEFYGEAVNISSIPPWLVLASIIFATLVGMVAGFFPAQRATRLSPLAAIRNE